MKQRSPRLIAAAFVLLCTSRALADPIVITSGDAGTRVAFGDLTSFSLAGVGTHIVSDAAGTDEVPAFRFGDTVVLRSFVGPVQFHPSLNTMVDGVLYPSVWLAGMLNFAGDPFVAPSAPDGTQQTFPTTFTMNGRLQGYADSARTMPLFDVALTGSGNARSGPYRAFAATTSWVDVNGGTAFEFTASSVSPTPEPATMLLVGTGLVFAGRRRVRQRT